MCNLVIGPLLENAIKTSNSFLSTPGKIKKIILILSHTQQGGWEIMQISQGS